ncbi:MAG: nucleotidyltransferase domain-containing protein [Candidatus Aenigmarchaeota archaeon]|nr:nucleotidyltransferase domain-containing protein [Candidatus Aenigmarchaeota archaeon]
MSRKDYEMEIVVNLLKKENHVRGIAKNLGSNQTTIARKLNNLSRANVVDHKMEGKNKIYSLKKNIEARIYVYMAEHYKFLKTIENYPSLRKIITNIQKNKKIGLAILFGSYAKGRATNDSDIDIYIATEDRELKKKIELVDSRLNVKIGKYNQKSPLIKEIEKDHVILKGVEIYYEKNNFFE